MNEQKSALEKFLSNHVLCNLFFLLVLVLGTLTYLDLPRQQDPTINFNWIQITTILPGASASDIETSVTNPLEEGLESVKDIKFVSSSSREGVSSILVRFNDISTRVFDKRISDIERVIQQKSDELPEDASEPDIFEITSSNAYPSVTIVLSSETDGETLHYQARRIKRTIERLKRVDRVTPVGLNQPEIHITYDPDRLTDYRLSVNQLSATIQGSLKNTAPGDIQSEEKSWLIRVLGIEKTPQQIAQIPIVSPVAEIALSTVAKIERTRSEPSRLVRHNGKPAVLLSVMKKDRENTLELVEQLTQYTEQENQQLLPLGLELKVSDDQTEITRSAINIMQSNFMIGLTLVFLVSWLFLGTRIALMTTIGIPFTIAGTFILLGIFGFTLNTSVLLGVVIALGMLVDDAVVVVESIYFKMRNGVENMTAITDGIKEVVGPVTTSVLTTSASFAPLMMMPGILGKFMLVVPVVVTSALFISLLEAYWLLPSHVMMMKLDFKRPSRVQKIRNRAMSRFQYYYAKLTIRLLRHRLLVFLSLIMILVGTIAIPINGLIKFNFFASDSIRLFYVNVVLPAGKPLEKTMEKVIQVEKIIKSNLSEKDYRSVVSYSGIVFTETEPLFGNRYGQIQISLKSKKEIEETGEIVTEVEEIVDRLRPLVAQIPGTEQTSFLVLSGGPPSSKPINMKILGDRYSEIDKASDAMKTWMSKIPTILDISDDSSLGSEGFDLHLNYANMREFNMMPQDLVAIIASFADGLFLTTINIENEQVDIRLFAEKKLASNEQILSQILDTQIVVPEGSIVSLKELVDSDRTNMKERIRHYNFRRAITIEADINKEKLDTVQANQMLAEHWKKIRHLHPGITVDFSGELDDIQESLDAMLFLFVLGIGLIYLILGTQFRSYTQPVIVLTAIPMAFTGVIIGTLITGYALSLFALYGIVALSGIAVNASIVMIATANRHTEKGIPKIRAIVYASRRRLIPITITTLTTVAGLFSLAIGLGGKSLLWGPMASNIVFGLLISSTLTVLFLPSIYMINLKQSLNFTPWLKKILSKLNQKKGTETIAPLN